jgi:hypothetical protein
MHVRPSDSPKNPAKAAPYYGLPPTVGGGPKWSMKAPEKDIEYIRV